MEGLVFEMLEFEIIEEIPRLPKYVRDIVSSYCFGVPLKIDTILKTMKKDDVSEQ